MDILTRERGLHWCGINELYPTLSHAGHMYLLGKHLHQAFN